MLRILRSFVDFSLFSQILGSRYPRHAHCIYNVEIFLDFWVYWTQIKLTQLKMKLNFSARIFFIQIQTNGDFLSPESEPSLRMFKMA